MRGLLERNVKKDEIVEVKIKKSEINFVVWIIPVIALLIGGWMIYRYYAKLGPEVVIYFKNSGGLEPKQSFVKFRDVKVGVVERIEILKQKEGVAVYARMNKDVTPFLNEKARFWIVKPEIAIGKVRGLDALVSGSYIQMASEVGGKKKVEFQGLDEAPLDIILQEGRNFWLKSSSSYTLTPGLPVYFKDLEVGSIKKVELDKSGEFVNIYIFVKKPYDSYINSSTKFWNIRGVDINLAANGINLNIGTLSQLLIGGVEFFTPVAKLHEKIDLHHPLWLYPSKESALHKKLGVSQTDYRNFLLRFNKGVGYLQKGAPVKFKGFEIGSVKDIKASVKGGEIDSEVIASIDVAAFKKTSKEGIGPFEEAVKNGLKARLEQSNILTKTLFVNLVFDKKPGALHQIDTNLYLLPTLPVEQNSLIVQIQSLLTKLEKLPIEHSINAFSNLLEKNSEPLRQTLLSLRKSSDAVTKLLDANETKALPKELHTLLKDLQHTLKSYETLAKSYSNNSLFKKQLTKTLEDIDRASKALRKVLLKLDKKPNALIFGD